MIKISYYFKIKVTYHYKISTSDIDKTDSAEYEIILNNKNKISYDDATDEAWELATTLNKQEFGDLPHYVCDKLSIIQKKIIYIKD